MDVIKNKKKIFKESHEFSDLRKTFYLYTISSLIITCAFSAISIYLIFDFSDNKITTIVLYILAGIFSLLAIVFMKILICGPNHNINIYIKNHPDLDIYTLKNDKINAEKINKRLFIGLTYTFIVSDFGVIDIVLNDDVVKAYAEIADDSNDSSIKQSAYLVLVDKDKKTYRCGMDSNKAKSLAKRYEKYERLD